MATHSIIGSSSQEDLDDCVRRLEESGEFKVLRRLAEPTITRREIRDGERMAVVLDTETTGLNLRKDEVTELAMLAFAYNEKGEVTAVLDSYSALREPSVPISSESAAITGITSEMVKGQRLDMELVQAFIAPAGVIIAHNAAFDRPMCEKLSDAFSVKSWACTATQLDWPMLGFEGRKLIYLLYQFGYFHDGHRAADDAGATLELLRLPLPRNGGTTLPTLLANARLASVRLFVDSVSEMAPVLRSRGYRWQSGNDVRPRSWWIEVPEKHLSSELLFLRDRGRDVRSVEQKRITAFERFKFGL